jgi:thioredoxin-related protein
LSLKIKTARARDAGTAWLYYKNEGGEAVNYDRRKFIKIPLALGVMTATLGLQDAAQAAKEPEVADNGLFTKPWFHETFLDLREDLGSAAEQGKKLAILWEQRGCPYCRELHRVNLEQKEITDLIKEHFLLIQLDLWGSREVTDFDGKAMEERELAVRWGVNFTPTINFFAKAGEGSATKNGRELEVARMPGYFKPFHFLSMFSYVQGEHYNRPNLGFQRYVRERAEHLREQGREVKLW